MSVPLNASRPYRWQVELIELVEAVVATDPNNESTWIEWKSQLDLNSRSGQEHIAKHVLGFANRVAHRASQHAGGYAYLIVGAEPGTVHGITSVDPAMLHPAIVRWVGTDARFHLEYVPVRTKTVLVVVVEPPALGDPIYPLRSQLGSHEAGRILVRRPGATHPANAHEIDELNARVRASCDRIRLTLGAASIETLPRHADFDELVEEEHKATLARPWVGPAKDTNTPFTSALGVLASIPDAFSDPDRRTVEEYEQEVATYATAYRQALEHTFAWMIWHHDPCWLHLEAQNVTDLNFTDVRLELHIVGQIRRWSDDWSNVADGDKPAFPNRPPPLGTRTTRFDLGAISLPSISQSSVIPSSQMGPRYSVTDSGSVTITLEHFDLRAKQRLQLQPIPVLVEVPAGTLLTCDWTATALNVSGQDIGQFTVTVMESTFKDGSDHAH